MSTPISLSGNGFSSPLAILLWSSEIPVYTVKFIGDIRPQG
ncbi:MAG: hypothetical protein OWQ48_05275 [Desulfurococcus sp.]|nr:hypothetical protein [Desulfurococcus sp.]